MKICSRCLKHRGASEFYPDRTHRDGLQSRCKECVKADRRARYAADPELHKTRMREYAKRPGAQESRRRRFLQLRDAAFNAYGGRCSCCGETEYAFLTIDHVGGWGAEHRRTVGEGASNIYQWLKANNYPQDGRIAVLCWNCNCAEGVRGGCPHKKSDLR